MGTFVTNRMAWVWVAMGVVAVGVVAEEEQPRVVTPWGTFLGKSYTSAREGRQVYAFTGIPYAKPPLGDLRFREPVPYGAHLTPFNATGDSPACLQWDNLRGRGAVGQEDCLYLNVYTNTLTQPPMFYNTQPVVMFLHAGTWMAGSGGDGLLQPDYMLESDVTVVTINHRLGPFGFLSTEDQESPGNFGLMDQVVALEWVRNNIRHFGGMNDSITVMGSGAGGISVHLLVLSPKTRAASIYPDDLCLFHKAISQSGTAYSPHAIVRNARSQALKFGLMLGCPTATSQDLMRCLRSIPGSKIVDQMPSMYVWDEEPVPFGPVIDKWQGNEAFLPDEPHHLIRHQQFLQIPWMVGTNKNDGAFRVQDVLKDTSLTEQLNKQWEKYGPILLDLKETSCKDPVEIANRIRKYYMGKKKFGEESSQEFVEMLTDRFFLYPTDHAVKDHSYYLKGKYCYRYELVYTGRKSFLDILHHESPQEAATSAFGAGLPNPRFQNTRGAHGWGVSFLDELLYLFPSSKLDFVYKRDFNSDSASRVSTHMIMLWTNFIKGSDPTPVLEGWPDDISPWGAWWEPFLGGYLYYLQIDPDMDSKDVPLKDEQMTFWNDLPLYENRDHNVLRDEL
ncbi:juvenile hormone esterase-like [Homarus americanus]|uniref:Esterase E4-like1 n=1 Tax=Homarus americanus TaxID=6706 RepID=A0A8J5N9G8_HOMAM|nr:juvenile hormone esterase-like [Homarus americanus]KAG7176035.1 Esterase E4-like1 [Homarus americanus]